MAHLFDANLVRLLCSCGLMKPITGIYFCRHCVKLRCSNCVSHELDMRYCPNCLENMPAPEARLKKNRCGNCFDCPSCGQSLSTRLSIQSPDPEQPSRSIQRKLYFLSCSGCRWTSRDVNIPDQTVATGGWPEQEPPNKERILSLLEHYRAVALRDKMDRERKKQAAARVKKSPASFLRSGDAGADKLSSVSSSLASAKKSLAAINTYAHKGDTPLTSQLTPAEASEEVEGLPDDIFTEPVVLAQVCSVEQRLRSPEQQPSQSSSLYPLHKHMLVKRSLRCRHCEHNLSKPEYNPSSIKFKIQLGAYYHVPDVRLVRPVPLSVGQEARVELSLCNPTPHLMPLALLPFLPHLTTAHIDAGVTASSPGPRFIEVPTESCLPELCTSVTLPQGQLLLAPRDDTAEYGDADAHNSFKDDPQVVTWRRANKVGVTVCVTPEAVTDALYIGFLLRYDYTNNMISASSGLSSVGPVSLGPSADLSSLGSGPPSGPSSLTPSVESRTVTLNVPVIIKLGAVSASASESTA
ncbi:dynactin subunit 4 [Hyalella azteca]|uniref:Dynactin subunit 4 n=1 Tax=Hyalella azteca TaxID=294128 RepID=A0A8B7N958_HYAAZ|nr:dynactin subunit 4 [Hyalella azteca]